MSIIKKIEGLKNIKDNTTFINECIIISEEIKMKNSLYLKYRFDDAINTYLILEEHNLLCDKDKVTDILINLTNYFANKNVDNFQEFDLTSKQCCVIL